MLVAQIWRVHDGVKSTNSPGEEANGGGCLSVPSTATTAFIYVQNSGSPTKTRNPESEIFTWESMPGPGCCGANETERDPESTAVG